MLRGWLAALPLVAFGACTAILGDDFVIEPGSSSATSSTGAAGGAGPSTGGAGTGGSVVGGGGAGPILPYECQWALSEHQRVAALSPSDNYYDMLAIGREEDDSLDVRLFIEKSTPSGSFLELWTLGSQTEGPRSFAGNDVADLRRLDDNAVGLLYEAGPVGAMPVLKLEIVTDDDPGGVNSTTHELHAPTDVTSSNVSARYAPNPAPASRFPVRVVTAYGTVSGYVERYVHYNGTSSSVVELTQPGRGYDSLSDVEPQRVMFRDDRVYAVMGFYSDKGPHIYQFDDSVSAPLAPHYFGPQNALPLDAIDRPGGINFAIPLVALSDQPFPIHVGRLAYDDLDAFTVLDLPIAKTFMPNDAPGGSGAWEWIDDMFVLIATTPIDDTQLRYTMFDHLGNERGVALLPFNAPLAMGETREDIGGLAMARGHAGFSTTGGRLHVAWVERHSTASAAFDVLYYDQLECTPVAP
jgi:hypothetical protein